LVAAAAPQQRWPWLNGDCSRGQRSGDSGWRSGAEWIAAPMW